MFLDLSVSNFNKLLSCDIKILKDAVNLGNQVPNLSQDTDITNIHCDLVNDSLVDSEESDTIII